MNQTRLDIIGEKFWINDRPVYSEIPGSRSEAHGLLMNARFIQGVFDDKADRLRYNRFGREFDPERNTDQLIASLPQWYAFGLRAFTVGFQGGGPCFTIKNALIDNNPFGEDGTKLDPRYAERMDRLIRAADALGMVVIVSYLYPGQCGRLQDGRAVIEAVRTASRFLKAGGYSNVIVEVCNEHNIDKEHPLVSTPEGMVALMDIARAESGGLPVGCSGTGSFIHPEICRESDVILIHANGLDRQQYNRNILKVKSWAPGKPVVCNEDSPAIGQLKVALDTHTSWGYYNNMTKQEPPCDWGITRGEDQFFAYRLAEGLGLERPLIPLEEQYYLQGLEEEMTVDGKRWVRLASLYPETIDYVQFYQDGVKAYTSYSEPFTVNYSSTWKQGPWVLSKDVKEIKAVIYLRDGTCLDRNVLL